MDKITRAFYELTFENHFIKKRGNEFQNLFCEIMELRYPGDFVRTRPWGTLGDRKNDGYLKSSRMLFQVYAPNEMTLKDAKKKINEDFKEALKYWEEYFDNWVFTHNGRDGLSPDIRKLLHTLNTTYPVKVTDWGFAELREVVFSLDETHLSKVLGNVPSSETMLRVGFEQFKTVLAHIKRLPIEVTTSPNPVPPGKLKFNDLSDHVQLLLNVGFHRSERVKEFFRQWHNPTYGDQIAQAFKIEYNELKSQNYSPDEIFSKLQEFVGGDKRLSPEDESAVLTILAYFFESCDIFESPSQQA